MLKTRIVPNDLILALNTKLSTVPCVYIEYLPPTPTFSSILRSAVFEIEGYEISEMHRMITDWPLNCQKACRIHRIFTPKGHFLSVSPIRPAVSWYKVVENRKCTEWLQSELWLNCQKYTLPCIRWILTPNAQISLPFARRPVTRFWNDCSFLFSVYTTRVNVIFPGNNL